MNDFNLPDSADGDAVTELGGNEVPVDGRCIALEEDEDEEMPLLVVVPGDLLTVVLT